MKFISKQHHLVPGDHGVSPEELQRSRLEKHPKLLRNFNNFPSDRRDANVCKARSKCHDIWRYMTLDYKGERVKPNTGNTYFHRKLVVPSDRMKKL